MFKKILKSQSGEGYIDVVIMVLASMMMLVISINIFSLIADKQKLDYFSKELLSTAATYGRISSEVSDRYNELQIQTGLSPATVWSAVYFDTSDKKVQLADTITVKLTLTTDFQGTGELLSIPLKLTAGGSTLSERYWK
jgi:hypothetical protein